MATISLRSLIHTILKKKLLKINSKSNEVVWLTHLCAAFFIRLCVFSHIFQVACHSFENALNYTHISNVFFCFHSVLIFSPLCVCMSARLNCIMESSLFGRLSVSFSHEYVNEFPISLIFNVLRNRWPHGVIFIQNMWSEKQITL